MKKKSLLKFVFRLSFQGCLSIYPFILIDLIDKFSIHYIFEKQKHDLNLFEEKLLVES